MSDKDSDYICALLTAKNNDNDFDNILSVEYEELFYFILNSTIYIPVYVRQSGSSTPTIRPFYHA